MVQATILIIWPYAQGGNGESTISICMQLLCQNYERKLAKCEGLHIP